ncbi:transporter substrate-binding domain-containing protein [Spirulina major CS-329]|nr:transporter substrate-binding domain-containing protein [Spirulina major CS-329]
MLGGAIALPLVPVNPLCSSYATEWPEIQAQNRLTVAVKDNTPPLGFVGSDGQLQGFEIEVARAVVRQILGDDATVEFVPVQNRDRVEILYREEADITIAGVTATTMRSRLVYFSRPYYFNSTSVITRQAGITQFTDLAGQPIAVLPGSSAIAVLRHRDPSVALIGVESYQGALDLLEAGQAAAFAGDRTILIGWQQAHPAYRVLPDRLSSEPLAIAIPKGPQTGALLVAINQALQTLEESGWLQAQQIRWGLLAP